MVTSIASTQEISLDFGPKWRLSSVTAPVDSPYSFRSSSGPVSRAIAAKRKI